MVESTVTHLGCLDVVVANAAIARDVPFGDLDDARFEEAAFLTGQMLLVDGGVSLSLD